MNKFVPWLKAHWPIPVLLLVAVAALPAAWYFASSMSEDIKKDYETQVKKDYDSVSDSAAMVSYGVPSVDGTGKLLERKAPANEAMIKAYAGVWQQVQAKVGAVAEKGLAFNRGEHKLLTAGLFPKVPSGAKADQDVKALEFITSLIAFHRHLLEEARAGKPPAANEVGQALNEHVQQEREKIKAQAGRDPNEEETKKLQEDLLAMRLGAYRKRASEIGVYADYAAFEGIPAEVPTQAPGLPQLWDYQERAWVHQDVMQAVRAANSSGGVPDGVVKRILSINVSDPTYDAKSPQPPAAAYDAGEDRAPSDWSKSPTGRWGGPGTKNKWYDVRPVRLELIVSSQRLPEFVDALAATNFMTVIDMDLSRVDTLADLKDGYFYGDEHVVRASLLVETVWLREWRKADMPAEVQRSLGMVEGEAGAPAAAPAPSPAARPRPGGGGRPAPGGGGRPGPAAGGGRED